jgi:hypothetical protein
VQEKSKSPNRPNPVLTIGYSQIPVGSLILIIIMAGSGSVLIHQAQATHLMTARKLAHV